MGETYFGLWLLSGYEGHTPKYVGLTIKLFFQQVLVELLLGKERARIKEMDNTV